MTKDTEYPDAIIGIKLSVFNKLMEENNYIKDEINNLNKVAQSKENKIEEIKELFYDVCCQAFGEFDRKTGFHKFDHSFISTYENAIDYMLENKMITKEQVVR